jgi:hypothetical protein
MWEREFKSPNGRAQDLELSVYAIDEVRWCELCVARMLAHSNDPPRFVGGVDLEKARHLPVAQTQPEDSRVFQILETHKVLPFAEETALKDFVDSLHVDIGDLRVPSFVGATDAVREVLRRKGADAEWQEALNGLAGSRRTKWERLTKQK